MVKTNQPCSQGNALHAELDEEFGQNSDSFAQDLHVARCDVDSEPCIRCPTIGIARRTALEVWLGLLIAGTGTSTKRH
jgi:hypothetical protein